MAVSNRFDLLAFLSVNDESTESSTNDIHLPEQEQVIDNRTNNFWEIPEYVDKPIPCVAPVVSQEKTPKSVVNVKSSGQNKKVKPSIVNKAKPEEDEQEIFPVVEVHTEPKVSSYYPPQPYKFKPAAASHRNENVPKFNRKNNSLPKHASVRGNSKSCTHQI